MTHYDHGHRPGVASGPERRSVLTALAIAGSLVAVATLSSLYLASTYKQAAPYRTEQARQAQERRLAAERAAAERDRLADLPVTTSPDTAEFAVAVPDVGRERIGQPSASAGSSRWVPLEWAVQPRYSVQPDQLKGDHTRVSSRLTCVAEANGRLTQCRGVDTPAGTGLSALLVPQISQARVVPTRVEGRAVATSISLTVSFEITRAQTRPDSPPSSSTSINRPSAGTTPFLPTNPAPQNDPILPSIIPTVPQFTPAPSEEIAPQPQ